MSIKTISLSLVYANGGAVIDYSNLQFAFFATPLPVNFGAPEVTGNGVNITGGLFEITLHTALNVGDTGFLILTNTNGLSTQSPSAIVFAGPVLINNGDRMTQLARNAYTFASVAEFNSYGGAVVYGEGPLWIGGVQYWSNGSSITPSASSGAYNAQSRDQFPLNRIAFASFGDSYTDIGTVNNVTAQDIATANASNTPVGLSSEKFAAWLLAESRGVLYPVYNGGIGGQTTTQIAARAVAAYSAVSTSKSLIGASLAGARVVIISASVNDFTTLTTASSAGAIESTKTTALANLKIIINKCRSLGMLAVFHAIHPLGVAPTADQQVVNSATLDHNARVAAYISTISDYAIYWDKRAAIQAPDGGWLNQYTDALVTHTNHACCALIYPDLAKTILAKLNRSVPSQALPQSQNMFSNADLSASSSGLATGIAIGSVNGTATNTITQDFGINTQKIVFVPGNANGTDSTINIDIDLLAGGATPFVALSVGDKLSMEMDVWIDDGAGNAANFYAMSLYLRKMVGATPTIFNTFFSTFGGTTTRTYLEPLNERLSGGEVVIDEATSASSGVIRSRLTIVSQAQGANIVIRLANIRLVKLPPGY